jgi:hypothetical protein
VKTRLAGWARSCVEGSLSLRLMGLCRMKRLGKLLRASWNDMQVRVLVP